MYGSGIEQMIIFCHTVKNTFDAIANILNFHQIVCLGSRRDHEFVSTVQFLRANHYLMIWIVINLKPGAVRIAAK
jgi:hypothetical protein